MFIRKFAILKIRKILNSIGYDISRFEIVDQYESLYRRLYSADSIKNKRFYNIGESKSFLYPFWTLIDLSIKEITPYMICYDLCKLLPLPIDSNSAEIIYSSHTIEHINDQAAKNMFKECFRVLKEDGFLRIVAPDIDLCYRAYKDQNYHFYYWAKFKNNTDPQLISNVNLNKPLNKSSIQQLFLHRFAFNVSTLHNDGASERIQDNELDRIFSQMEYEKALNYCISKCSKNIQKKYPGNHINWWNKDKIIKLLQQAGFTKIYISGYGQSFNPILQNITLFDNTHPKMSVYIEAIK